MAEENYRVDVLAIGETTWVTNSLEYATSEIALGEAKSLKARWTGADRLRVVPVSTPKNEEYVEGSEDIS